jgi:hypothetical protein
VPVTTDNIVQKVWNEYQKGLSFNTQQDLDETVRTNENFVIGKQWEGVEANGLPTPVFNFLKRVVLYIVASIVPESIKYNATPFNMIGDRDSATLQSSVVNAELEKYIDFNNFAGLLREFARNAAVDKDGCLFTYWDADIKTGQPVSGAMCTETIENTRVFFGNVNDRKVQKQPYIIISSREMIDEVRDRAKDNGVSEWESIMVDSDDKQQNSENMSDDKVTVLMRLRRDKKTKTIWAVEVTKNAFVRKEWDTGLTLYPIVWMNWDYVQDNYHGQAMVSGLIPNQIFVNKLFAMSMISLMTTAYPKIIYDKTRVTKWDNRVGAAIPVNGGDVNSVAKILDPATISPQIAQFIQLAVEMTQQNMGATSTALGDDRPYNTSALTTNLKSSIIPHEITKQNLYQCVVEQGRICIDMMRNHFGVRTVDVPIPDEVKAPAQFVGMQPNKPMSVTFDFSTLENTQFNMKLDAGASTNWSEIASLSILETALQYGLPLSEYFKRIPNGFILKQEELIASLEGQQANMPVSMGAGMNSVEVAANGSPPPNPTTVGMQNFQEAVM